MHQSVAKSALQTLIISRQYAIEREGLSFSQQLIVNTVLYFTIIILDRKTRILCKCHVVLKFAIFIPLPSFLRHTQANLINLMSNYFYYPESINKKWKFGIKLSKLFNRRIILRFCTDSWRELIFYLPDLGFVDLFLVRERWRHLLDWFAFFPHGASYKYDEIFAQASERVLINCFEKAILNS